VPLLAQVVEYETSKQQELDQMLWLELLAIVLAI
jgi:hypothetical protein